MSLFFMESREHVFTWKIENFKSCFEEKGENLSSPIFVAESLDNSTWRLNLYPKGSSSSDDGFISCFLQRNEDDFSASEIKCEFKIDVVGANGEILISNMKTEIFKRGDLNGWSNYKDRNLFLKEWEKLCEKTLTIRCRLLSIMPRVKQCSENVAITKVCADHFSFRCIIDNVNTSTNLKLMKFPSMGTSQVEVLIQIPEDDIKICIRRVEGFTDTQCVACKITLLDVKGEIADSKSDTHFFKMLPPHGSDTWEFPSFLKMSRLNIEKDKYLVGNCFTLMFDISVTNGSKSETIENVQLTLAQNYPSDFNTRSDSTMVMLKTDFTRLFTENIQSDVNLRIQDQVYPAHKAILSARSPVFFAMFNNNMAENRTGDVEISDLDAQTMKSLIKFLYIGETVSLDYELASKLMIAADKYQIYSLKEKCAIFLKLMLSIENVCDILVLADLVEHKILKASAMEFIMKHSGYIFCSTEWKSFIKKNLSLASETISKVSLFLLSDRDKNNPMTRNQPDSNSKTKSATPSTQSTGGSFGATSTSIFGTSRPAFGGFGATNSETAFFGQNTSTGTILFGSTVGDYNSATKSGTKIMFNPPIDTDTLMEGGVSITTATKFQCITVMKEYEEKSLEELRAEDYAYAANGKGARATPAFGFDIAQVTIGDLFGAPAAASTPAFNFSSTTQSKPLFEFSAIKTSSIPHPFNKSTAFSNIPLHSSTTDVLASSGGNISSQQKSPISSFNFGSPSSNSSLKKFSKLNFPIISNENASQFPSRNKDTHGFSFSTPVSSNNAISTLPSASSSTKEVSSFLNKDISAKQSSSGNSFNSVGSFTFFKPQSKTLTTASSTVSPISSSVTNAPITLYSAFPAVTTIGSTATNVPITSTSTNSVDVVEKGEDARDECEEEDKVD